MIKKILWVFLIIGLSGIFLNGYVGMSEVHATGEMAIENTSGNTSTNGQNIDTSMWQILNIVLKIIYLLLWPLLVIAWLALDNTLVYASVFHLDAPLWQFWNMMKNFANFALWFMVLFAIIKSIFSNSWEWTIKDEKSPLGIIKVTLIAGILIQASWFLMAAVIDISTIATYAVGGLPLSVLNNTKIGDQKILTVNSSIDLNKFNLSFAWGEEFKIWYSTKHPGIPEPDQTVTISPCRVANSYIIWREFGDTGYNVTAKLNSMSIPAFQGQELCVIYGNQLVMRDEIAVMEAIKGSLPIDWPPVEEWFTDAVWYNYYMNALVTTTWWDSNPTFTWKLVYLGSGGSAFAKGDEFFSGTISLTINNLIQKSKWFVGPLVTIYSSLLNFAQLTSADANSISWTSGIFIIKSLVALALFFPLIALALVLILRIGVLWLYIVASPFIILKASFKLKMGSLDTYLDIKNVMWIIFAPVVTVAALSISLIFMTALVNGFTDHTTSANLYQTFETEKAIPKKAWNDAIIFKGIVQLEYSKLPWWEAMDRFSWLMVNFFAIGLMWMIFFAALKSNELGKMVGGKVESFGANVFKTLPIIPMGPEGKWVGIGSIGTVVGGMPDTYISNLKEAWNKQVRDWIDDKTGTGNPGTGSWSTTFNAQPIVQKLWGLASTPTATTITEAIQQFTDSWITDAKSHIENNTQAYFQAIQNMSNDQAKQTKAIAWIEAIIWNTNWYENMLKDSAKAALDTITKAATSESNLKTILETAGNADKVNAYFDVPGTTEYTITTTDNKTYKATKNTTTPVTYTITQQQS